jgi:hypothetical protein
MRDHVPTCIYCGASDVTVEHPLPRALGNFKGYVPLEDKLCSRCNVICGQLDEQLCRCGSEAFFRKFLGVTGRSGHEDVNPFYRGSSRGGRLEMTGTNHDTGQEKELELTGPNSVRELRCAKLITEDGSIFTITITDGMTKEEFQKRVIATGVKLFKHVELSAAPEEIPWVESLFEGFTMKGKAEWVQPAGPIIYGPHTIKFTVTDRYFRAIAKIGFHYFLTKFRRFRGDEPCFADIRNFIIKDCSLDEVPRFVTYSREPFVYQLRAGDRLSAWGHLISTESNYTDFRAKVQLFVGPETRPLVYTVQLGKNPSPIHYSEAYGDFFAYYPADERHEYDGEISELGAVVRV